MAKNGESNRKEKMIGFQKAAEQSRTPNAERRTPNVERRMRRKVKRALEIPDYCGEPGGAVSCFRPSAVNSVSG